MKHNKYYLILLGLIIVIGSVIYSSHSFTMESATALGSGYKPDSDYYLGFNMHWKGFFRPTIKDVQLLRRNGVPYNKDDYDLEHEFYVDKKKHTGVIDSSELKKNSQFYEYVSAYGYKITDSDMQIVLRVKFKNTENYNDFKGIKIKYRLLLLNRTKIFDFDKLYISQ